MKSQTDSHEIRRKSLTQVKMLMTFNANAHFPGVNCTGIALTGHGVGGGYLQYFLPFQKLYPKRCLVAA
eukprot:1273444-Rhodomonas_salina.1